MGIYISGLNMPDRYAQIVIHADGSVSVFDDDTNCFQETKAKAVNVPNHGRSVDADALASRFDNGKQIISLYPFPEEFKAIYSQLADEMKDEIRKCPTIIPADVTDIRVGNICSGRDI